MRRRRPPTDSSRRSRPGGRGPRGAPSHVVLVAMGVGLYLAVLWLGIVVIEDNPLRSAIFAALIVAIAAAGYVFTRPHAPRD